MKTIMVTGSGGYIGTMLVDQLLEKGYSVIGLDRYFFGEDILGSTLGHPHFKLIKKDIRDIEPKDFEGVDAVCDLAALSNDPSSEIDESLTYSINYSGRVKVATLGKQYGVKQYILASSCSVYGAGESENLVEESTPRPISTYAKANLKAENDILPLADNSFVVTVLRQATIFGLAKRMRFDLVLNLMTLNAVQKSKVFVMGGGFQWRPLLHIKDTTGIYLTLLDSDRSTINGQIFNVGSSEHNYQIINIAYIIRENIPFPLDLDIVPDDDDKRNYRVSFKKVESVLGFKAKYLPADGVKEIYQALKMGKVDTGIKTVTVKWYKNIIEAKALVDRLAINGKLL